MTKPQRKITTIVSRLLEWYPGNARDLPWRRASGPYGVYVSEIMLQQTQVKAVVPYWERWMRELPTIGSLARARPERIHKLWEGLGYYTRVRNMQRAARQILKNHGGRFPTSFEKVLELPGIGRYTAGAICSIAFNQPCPVLDGNVIRVLARVFGIAGNPRDKAANAQLWAQAENLVRTAQQSSGSILEKKIANRKSQIVNQNARCSNLNQALMELGALVCTPRSPGCGQCPLTSLCTARKEDRIDTLPGITPRPQTTRRRFVAFVIKRGDEVLVRQRPAGVVNAHLWEFPNLEVAINDGDPGKAGLRLFRHALNGMAPVCSIQHSITRYRIQLDVFEASLQNSKSLGPELGRWIKRTRLQLLAFTGAHKKLITLVMMCR